MKFFEDCGTELYSSDQRILMSIEPKKQVFIDKMNKKIELLEKKIKELEGINR